MQVKLHGYVHEANGISLQILPETPVEEALLNILWMHGHLEVGHPCGELGNAGFRITGMQGGNHAVSETEVFASTK